ncbi:MAG: PAS domain-containing protein [Deltaproteobacteria bacterium]|nr:PAS domain-containing protein [Deltaproteobacteria bacterium]
MKDDDRPLPDAPEADDVAWPEQAGLHLFLELTGDLICVLDRQGCFVRVNPAFTRILGYDPDELLGRSAVEFVHPDDWVLTRRTISENQAAQVPTFEFENRFLHKNGPHRWMHWRCAPVGSAGMLFAHGIDISERHIKEQVFPGRRSLLEQTQRLARMGGWELDLSTNRPIWTSEIYRMHEVDPDYIPTLQEAINFYEPESRVILGDAVERATRTGEGWDLELRFRTAKGNLLWVRTVGEVSFDATGKPTRLTGTFEDITRRKQAQWDREELDRRIQHAQKHESLALLAGGVAHDFNNLLLGIIGNADLALLDAGDDRTLRTRMEAILQTAGQAGELCKQIQAYAGRGAIALRAVNLTTLVEEMSRLLEVGLQRNTSLRFRFALDTLPVEADPAQIRQVILNLMANAVEAMIGAGGVVTITTGMLKLDDSDAERLHGASPLRPGPFAFVEVADTGVGMDAAMIARIFDPFFTTKTNGHGLGLAAAQGIVHRHGGAIRVESRLGGGTSVRVYFPAIAVTDEDGADVGDASGEQRGFRDLGTVLVVDDEPAIVQTAGETLRRAGYRVLTAPDGREAIRLVAREQGGIDLVLLDVTMPVLDGRQTLRHIGEIAPDLPVILSSGHARHDVLRDFDGLTVGGFLQKPYRATDLIGSVHKALEQSRFRRQSPSGAGMQ